MPFTPEDLMTNSEARRSRLMGHLALFYRPEHEHAARVLLTDMGCQLIDNGWAPGQDGFCTALLDGPSATHIDNQVYLARMHDEQATIEAALDETLDQLGLGDSWRDTSDAPEIRPHFGIRFTTMQELEESMLAIEAHAAPGGPLDGHVRIRKFRARPGLDPGTDARMASSPLFCGDESPGFADHLVQCFVRTDLFGNLTSAGLIELDHAFPRFFERTPSFG
jgi:hypothetical protein